VIWLFCGAWVRLADSAGTYPLRIDSDVDSRGCNSIAIGHGIVAIGSELIRIETGLRFQRHNVSIADIYILPAIIVLGLLAGILPAVQHTGSGFSGTLRKYLNFS